MKSFKKRNKVKKQVSNEKIEFYEEKLLGIKNIISSSSPTRLNDLDKYILDLELNDEDRANIMLYTSVYLVENGFYDKASRYLKIIEKIEEKPNSVKDNYKKIQAKIKIRKVANKNRR